MPEGPEVYFLCCALQQFGVNHTAYWPTNIDCKGKHLLLQWTIPGETQQLLEDWSFGMTGKVAIDGRAGLRKVEAGYLPGKVEEGWERLAKLGVNWVVASPVELTAVVREKFRRSRATLGALLLKQDLICGIGVAWGSEILADAGLYPQLSACDQDLAELVPAMLRVRQRALDVYNGQMLAEAGSDKETLQALINGWFENLYARREMRVYKCGKAIKIGQRTWWVS